MGLPASLQAGVLTVVFGWEVSARVSLWLWKAPHTSWQVEEYQHGFLRGRRTVDRAEVKSWPALQLFLEVPGRVVELP